jgi:hypothetical protein
MAALYVCAKGNISSPNFLFGRRQFLHLHPSLISAINMVIDFPDQIDDGQEEGKDLDAFPDEFPTISISISYQDFFSRFIARNMPCLIKGDIIKDWPSRKDWVTSEGRPNLNFLLQNVVPRGKDVPVSHCDKKYFNSQQCFKMNFGDYCDYFNSAKQPSEDDKEPNYYLKDWHFHREHSNYKVWLLCDIA